MAAMLAVGALQLPMLHVTASAAEEAAFSVAENVSVQYRTLAADMTTKNQTEIEAGTVAATVSIDHNAGFRAATLVFDVSAGYEIVTDAFGEPLYHSDAVLDSFQIAATASDSENKLCVAVAAAKETQDTGAMLTLYLKPSAPSRSAQNDEIISVSDYTAPVRQTRVGAAVYGEINGDQIIDANDAAYILDAYVENNERALLVEHLTRVPTKGSYFFPNAASPICADCVQPEADGIIRVINMADSREVLKYGSASGAGNTYTGKVGTPIDTSNPTPGTFTGTPRVVYEYTMDVPFVNNDVINGHGTCWLATLVAKHN